MLTLHKTQEGTEIATLYNSENDKKGVPIYWHPKKEEKYKLGVDDSENYLTSENFRDYYKLSVLEAKAIAEALKRGSDVPDAKKGLQNKFFKVKKDLAKRLYTEMDLGDSKQIIRVDFPKNKKEWAGLHICIGCSGSGKTYKTVEWALRNLKGPPNQRRNFIYASAELSKDTTLKKLMAEKYAYHVRGIDLSDDAYEEWSENGLTTGGKTPDDWFNQEIKPVLSSARSGDVIILDDAKDSPAHLQMVRWQNTAFRTTRHKNVGLISIQHNMRGGRWTSQGHSSVKYVHTFPRGSGKGKLIDYLSKDIGTTLREARDYVNRYAEGGRLMTIRLHSPTCLIGPNGIILL